MSPFAVFPPRHGGARRVAEMLRALRRDLDIVLLSDEAHLYDARSFGYFDGLAGVELVQRREAPARGHGLEDRMASHGHRVLQEALADAIRRHRPHIVQIEHAELAALVALRTAEERWVLALHDAVRRADFADPAGLETFERSLAKFDAVTVCSAEDARLVHHPQVRVVPNGSAVPVSGYVPSAGHRLLFVGPFRYAPNAAGIARFLREVYGALRQRLPDLELVILGGDEAKARTADEPLFAQPGVRVLGHRDDIEAQLRAATLTINPLLDIRGSAVKVVESLAAGRVCVSTEDGARGLRGDGFAALVTVASIADMAGPIARLLGDASARHALERPDATRLAPYRWDACADAARSLYAGLSTPRVPAPTA